MAYDAGNCPIHTDHLLDMKKVGLGEFEISCSICRAESDGFKRWAGRVLVAGLVIGSLTVVFLLNVAFIKWVAGCN